VSNYVEVLLKIYFNICVPKINKNKRVQFFLLHSVDDNGFPVVSLQNILMNMKHFSLILVELMLSVFSL